MFSVKCQSSALGHLLSQILEAIKKIKSGAPVGEMDPAAAARYATFGFLITGPVSHIFYQLMEVQTSATGSAYFCPWLSADVLLCYEHPGGKRMERL
ncbi:hypothetical protein JOQ06_012180 [Pogonophryne albipinna]|uniref:Uncharacterized protein n=1 Tax=Pogonophryne albipinna TaxID=1090488 RepID=A0AAD6BCV4_9TELE|nr:hypothetical protein JOQ06_012180 [Pogonophryne albipinna]